MIWSGPWYCYKLYFKIFIFFTYLAVSVLEFMQGTQLYIIAVFVISNIEHITLF